MFGVKIKNSKIIPSIPCELFVSLTTFQFLHTHIHNAHAHAWGLIRFGRLQTGVCWKVNWITFVNVIYDTSLSTLSGLSYSRIIISFTLGKWVMFLLFWNKCWKYYTYYNIIMYNVHCTIESILCIINSEELKAKNQSF